LQLTNILRDLDEDAAINRLYLPQEFLRDAGIAGTDPESVLANPALPEVCERIMALARWRFSEADKIMNAHPRRMVRTPRVMSEAYKSILAGLAARGWAPPRDRVRLSKSRIAMIVLRHFII
jgi:phytoene synthase